MRRNACGELAAEGTQGGGQGRGFDLRRGWVSRGGRVLSRCVRRSGQQSSVDARSLAAGAILGFPCVVLEVASHRTLIGAPDTVSRLSVSNFRCHWIRICAGPPCDLSVQHTLLGFGVLVGGVHFLHRALFHRSSGDVFDPLLYWSLRLGRLS